MGEQGYYTLNKSDEERVFFQTGCDEQETPVKSVAIAKSKSSKKRPVSLLYDFTLVGRTSKRVSAFHTQGP